MEFFRKIIKNKILVLSVSVILVCVLYFVARKIIDDYEFKLYNLEGDEIIDVSYDEVSSDENEESVDNTKDDTVIIEDSARDTEMIVNEQDLNENFGVEGDEASVKIFVHVAGEVNNPGVVTLNDGARIVDAINATGGTTPNADISDVNLAYLLKDGMKVNIPNKDDVQNEKDFAYVISDSAKDHVIDDSSAESDDYYSDEALSVNINSATQTELESLPGIGPSLALKIISYRKENGKFSSIDELKNVSGIGDAKFEAIKDFVVIF